MKPTAIEHLWDDATVRQQAADLAGIAAATLLEPTSTEVRLPKAAEIAAAILDTRGHSPSLIELVRQIRDASLHTSHPRYVAQQVAAPIPAAALIESVVAALNHVSPYFADVVWDGLSTRHVRAGLEGHVDLATLRRLWLPISPHSYIERARDRRMLLIYARYDLTFPLRLSRELIGEFRRRSIPHELAMLPCGHYSSGRFPFNWMDGYLLTKFLVRNV